MTRERRENKTCQFEVNSTTDWKPVQLAQHWRDVFPPSSSSKKSSGGILDRLNLPDVAGRGETMLTELDTDTRIEEPS